MLPVNGDGNPNFEYMETFIRIQQKLVIKNAVEWKDCEIKTYKTVVES